VPAEPLPWDVAWSRALFGPEGFYRRPEGPGGHFRTACHAAPAELAGALVALARSTGCSAVVDVGAGRGELLSALARALEADPAGPDLRLHGADVVDRPADLPPRIGWTRTTPPVTGEPGATAWGLTSVLDGALVVAWELLDTVPCRIVVPGPDGPTSPLVDPRTGAQVPGPAPSDEDLQWCRRWWPVPAADGDDPHDTCVEVGRERDRAWAALVREAGAGGAALLLAVDYGHTAADRPPGGTLAGYRHGRRVPPVPDGSCDVTAHVAFDAVAAAGAQAGATGTLLTDQRRALRALGVTGRPEIGGRPGARSGGGAVAGLARAGREAELLDPGGLGGFVWLLQTVGGHPLPGL